jgi:hypothetical protein
MDGELKNTNKYNEGPYIRQVSNGIKLRNS